jgi:hypothetical protein
MTPHQYPRVNQSDPPVAMLGTPAWSLARCQTQTMNAVTRRAVAVGRRAAAGVAASLTLIGCAATHSATHTGTGSGSPPGGSTAPASSTAVPTTLTLTTTDTGNTVTAHIGDHLTVVLDSTYWTVDKPSGPVLRQDAPPTVVPSIAHCVPGGGCGTVTAKFTALAAGLVTIAAHRTTCGEAMRCTADQSTYRVRILIR